MPNPKATGKLLNFPARTFTPESVEQWIDQVLHTKDHLMDALEFLRIAYNEMLAGVPVREVDEIMAQVDAIVKSDKTMERYTVVGVIRTSGSRSPKATRSPLLLFPGSGERPADSRDLRH